MIEELQVTKRDTDNADSSAYRSRWVTDLAILEESLLTGELCFWDSLAAADSAATFYQGSAWCMEWYRNYADRFSPFVLVSTRGGELVGVAPMAVENSTNRLLFAGDRLSDYRDVVAAPGCRELVVDELLRIYRRKTFRDPLWVGPTLPESATVNLILERSAVNEVHAIPRFHSCWRMWLGEGTTKGLTGKESVRRHMNYYKRQGAVSLERVERSDVWDSIKEDFYAHHSLRQLQAARPVSFNDPRKRALYDALLRDHHSTVHITALRVGDKVIAHHYGYVWRGVLYWGAPAFDVREEKHSPGQILLALLLQDAEASGLRGVDFTLGTEDFKKRFGNDCVNLPSAEVYRRAGAYRRRKLRDRVVNAAKESVTRFTGGPERWDQVVSSSGRLTDELRRARELGLTGSVPRVVRRGVKKVGEKTKGLIFTLVPGEIREVLPTLAPGETCSFRDNEVGDLLKWDGGSRETAGEIQASVRIAGGIGQNRRTLHTVVINDQLASWGWSYWPDKPALITETQTTLDFEPNSVSLYGFHTVPEWRRRRLYQALLVHIVKQRFAEGAARAYIMCVETNVASRKAIERAGFRLVEVHEFRQFLRWKQVRRWQQPDVTHPASAGILETGAASEEKSDA
jgi:CelD/BcsL family acetyltransferase involved in cellulose biosynthesis/GNAT superfamily N-acetyltransferase